MGVDAANGLLTGGHPSYDFILSAESPVCPLVRPGAGVGNEVR